MIDTSGHHLVYGVLQDYLTGEELQDTDDERIRQDLMRLLVEDLGFSRQELEPRLQIVSEFNGKRVETQIELTASVNGKRLFILRYGAGSLVTREKAAIAAARILDPEYAIPLAVVTNGRDAELLDTGTGKVLATGMGCIPSREQAEKMKEDCSFEPYLDVEQRERALRILNVFDEEICCVGLKCKTTE
ncbi:type I restriction enzyme HsdR N-terminal domain-containing protein [Desulfogranum marinum]|jgi:hypothetical protein|uniref:type I restriction enzyme HsdR N-terminal domain-containing protein n=1 Tax=Desulfogranum marinum TaxID=453220 RepID=UPI0019659243|nr:type I restriction enzyme HsdR N-terminal domain-containing protein [Desulfogranum marinum]MBM9514347.1 type I restriction enzyme HsdR N-terminal domain-containing protein [Desulfogranum marinum]